MKLSEMLDKVESKLGSLLEGKVSGTLL